MRNPLVFLFLPNFFERATAMEQKELNVLIIGSGAREHALYEAILGARW